jgi:cytochrome c peroxidase
MQAPTDKRAWRPLARLLTLCAIFPARLILATDADDPAWRQFQHALGEPAWIAVNAAHPQAQSAYRPLPDLDMEQVDAGRFQLGFALFHDGRLSSGNGVACITCHAGAVSGVDGRVVAVGVGGARGTMNALSLFNAALNFRQFWDGRAITLEDQALQPIQNEVEMANSLEAVLRMLQEDARYTAQFSSAYPDRVTIANMSDAIAYFQRINFIRRDTPFQRELAGKSEGLDEQALRGWRRFDEIGCASCHNGINLGGNSYQLLGAALPYYGVEHEADSKDAVLSDRSGREQDRHVVKVPGLHGVATTAPYFHDGSIATLDAAIEEMARHQLGLRLEAQDVADIAAFLHSLNGRFDSTLLTTLLKAEVPALINNEGDHHAAYLAAMEHMALGSQPLLEAMQKVQRGEVAHFDFVQFEHLELIRHARALMHPPAALNTETSSAVVAQAEALLAQVNALEWTIADFLRAEAMIRVFSIQRNHPGLQRIEELGDSGARLSDYREQSARALADVSAADLSDAVLRLRQLYDEQRP